MAGRRTPAGAHTRTGSVCHWPGMVRSYLGPEECWGRGEEVILGMIYGGWEICNCLLVLSKGLVT